MAERNALLYLSIARRCAERGETGRAVITIINALQAHPCFIEQHPESIDFLAEILIPGCEEDLNRLEARHPVFGTKLRNALFAQGKLEAAREREENFNAYCIARMKIEHYDNDAYIAQQNRIMRGSGFQPSEPQSPQIAASRSIMTAAVPPALRAPSGGYRTIRRPEAPTGFDFSDGNLSSDPCMESGGDFYAVPRTAAEPVDFYDSPGRETGWTPPGRNCMPIGASMHCTPLSSPGIGAVPHEIRRQAILRRSDDFDAGCAGVSAQRSYHGIDPAQPVGAQCEWDAAISSASRSLPEADAVRREWTAPQPLPDEMPFFELPKPAPRAARRSHDSQTSPGDNSRRFDRITINKIVPEAPDYADNAADRMILDFDNRIHETPKSVLFAPAQTKFRSFEEDLAWTRELNARRSAARLTPAASPMEAVAETTHALTDTPSVEPYAARHPLRFDVSPRQILTCVALCVMCVLALVIYRSAEPDMEKRAIEGVSASYISAAESGHADPMAHVPDTAALLDPEWLAGYRLFLDTWQALHFEGSRRAPIDPESDDFRSGSAAVHAAYISQEAAYGHGARARAWLDRISGDTELWRTHPYFKIWSEAQIDEAANDLGRAAARYSQLLRTPIAPFAQARLGIIAIKADQNRNDIRSSFLSTMAQADNDHSENPAHVPGLALCARAILERDRTNVIVPNIEHLQSPYDEYCAIGRIFSGISHRTFGSHPNDYRDLALLKTSTMQGSIETSRIEAIVMAELFMQHPRKAVAYYKQITLPERHPQRIHLQNAILSLALSFGDWASLGEMFPARGRNTLFGAAHVIDAVRHQTPVQHRDFRESLVRYGGRLDLAPSAALEEAYVMALDGRTDEAVRMTRDILNAQPDLIEPVLLQASILSHSRRSGEAAAILEQALAGGLRAMPYNVLINTYRARAGMPLTPSASVLPFMVFADPVIESARCEILWRAGDKRAKSCIRGVSRNKSETTRAAWIMAHLDTPAAQPRGTSAQWAKAEAGALSFPGFRLAYARVLKREGQIRAAAKQYTHAIIDDAATASVQTIEELEKTYAGTGRRYEATRLFESIIAQAEHRHIEPHLIGALHLSAARLYQPKSKNSQAKIHLMRALDILGDRPDILRGFVEYYEAKDKPENAAKWRARMRRAAETPHLQQ